MMKGFSVSNALFLAVLAALAVLSLAAPSEVKVVVYSGPKTCSNKDLKKDEKPTKVEADYVVGLHFTVTVDESTKGSRETLGKKIESSRDAGIAPSFPVGQGKVVAGLDQGLIGLCKGASAYIIVPPHLAYGRMGKPEQGVGSDATLRYDVEIVDIQPPIPDEFFKIDGNKDGRISKEEAKTHFDKLGQALDLDALWKDEDKDGDGFITWEEFSGPKGGEPRAPTQKQQKKQQAGEVPDEMPSFFKGVDTNNDGKLNKEEMAKMFESLGQEMTEEFWAESDPDGDGYITYEEFIGSDNKGAGKGEEL